MELWILFALGAALSWGLYGPALHSGQVALGNNPMRALLCVTALVAASTPRMRSVDGRRRNPTA